LWRESSRGISCAVVRDSSYLNWKYVEQPGQHFIRVELLDDEKVCGSLHINAFLTRALRDCGFILRRPERFLLVDPGPLTGAALASVLSGESWYVTQGDSDIDRPW
jgi:hypothetical protein